jgi:hypothetical protein
MRACVRFWVLYELLFKFMITCALMFVKPGTPAQSALMRGQA